MNSKLATINNNNLSLYQNIQQETVWFENFISENSQKTYKDAITQFISFIGISSLEDLRKIENIHIIRFRDWLKNEGKSPATINNRLSAISSLFNHLIEKQVVKINPVIGVKRIRMNYSIVKSKCLTAEQGAAFLNVSHKNELQGLRDTAIFHVLFYTGCRISELGKLKVKYFKEDKGYMVLLFIIKGGKENIVALNQETIIAINNYLEASGHRYLADSPLFLKMSSNEKLNTFTPISRHGLYYLWHKYAKKINLHGSTPHSARTTLATLALENNCNIRDVQRTLGHSSIRTTQKYDQSVELYKNSASFAVRY